MNENIFMKFIHNVFGFLFVEDKSSDPQTKSETDSNGNFDFRF